MEENIHITVIGSLASKVMIRFVADIYTFEGKCEDEVVEESNSFLVVDVNIRIATYEESSSWILLREFLNTQFQVC